MNTCKKRIEAAIEQVLKQSLNWVRTVDKVSLFVDPLDNKEISAHYGATHMAASLILWGIHHEDNVLKENGLVLLKSILERWDDNVKLPAFHFDFNNFALCLIYDALDDRSESLRNRIREMVLKTPDSNHPTVNWLPMRMIVNQYRYNWTGNDIFLVKSQECASQIRLASYQDGGIEDRLPRGLSFNLQYDLATVAVLHYANVHGSKMPIEKELGFLLNAVAPDGDINYLGRGTNQVFAWGLWVYLLAASGQENELSSALDYFEPRLGIMLENNNIMLNEWAGAEKYLWWDYHYSSVYTAHLLLWLILAYQDYGKQIVKPEIPVSLETGLHIHHTDLFYVTWFDGRSEYLSEKGPAISCVWSKEYGVVCKGAFAPWHGAFGNTHSFDNVSIQNYCGLIRVRNNKEISNSRVIHRLFPRATSKYNWFRESPVFSPLQVAEKDGLLTITWHYEGREDVVLNVPSVSETLRCDVFADDVSQPLTLIGKIRNQYGWVNVYRTRPMKATRIVLRLL